MTRALDREAKDPLWIQLYDDLRRRLVAGEFSDAFPGEHALVADYEVSRYTVREALRRLRAEGVVTASRGRTSRVSSPAEIEQPLGTLYSLFASVGSSGLRQRSAVRVNTVLRDAVVADRIGLEGSTPLFHLERLRLADEKPLALDRVWLPAELASPLLEADFTETGLYAELKEKCSVWVTGGAEHIRAVVPTSAEQHVLAMPDNVAAFAIERVGFVGEQPVEWRHTVVRGDRFAVNADFTGLPGRRPGLWGHAIPG